MLSRIKQRFTSTETGSDPKFGTFAGVFTPTVLTILGAIMYLRLGQIVGNSGLIGAILIILLAHIITICTGLAVSSIATNTRVGAGGAFAIISQSLGLEVGGSIGVPLFLAQSVSVALYVLAFAETWVSIFEGHPAGIVAIIAFLLVVAIAYISAQFAARIQFFILAIVGISLVSIFMASFTIGDSLGFTEMPVVWGTFSKWDFWEAFAVFFPAVTGIMAGISLSGSLKKPRQSIPNGTMISVGLTMIIYLLLSVWLSRIATPEELIANTTIMVDKAYFGWAILAGMLGATFSSALGSLVAAPRVMQALAQHNLLPQSKLFAQETDQGEPRPALITTAVIAFAGLLVAIASGGLDAIAPIITMFFLITYAMLNVVVLFEQVLGTVSFRPTFPIPRIVPFVGMCGCIFVMFLVNPGFSLVAIVLVLVIYGILARRNLQTLQSDVRSGLFLSVAEWAAARAKRMPSASERTWKPTILAPVSDTGTLTGSYRFLWALAAPQGAVYALGIYPPNDMSNLENMGLISRAFLDDGIYSQTTMLEEADFVNGVRTATQILRSTFFRPNILFLHLRQDNDFDEVQALVEKTAAYQMGIVLLARHEVKELGREQMINVWVSNQGPDWKPDLRMSNLDLAILMAYQLAQNWQGRINLLTAVDDAETYQKAQRFLEDLVELTRLPKTTSVVVIQQPFMTALTHAPSADLSILGLSSTPDISVCHTIATMVDGSCVFVRDSGDESALA